MCVSVVIPVYNVEKYLYKCIRTILNQAYQDLELILVNDISKDRSLEIFNKYAKIDDRVRIINKENEGCQRYFDTGFINSISNEDSKYLSELGRQLYKNSQGGIN